MCSGLNEGAELKEVYCLNSLREKFHSLLQLSRIEADGSRIVSKSPLLLFAFFLSREKSLESFFCRDQDPMILLEEFARNFPQLLFNLRDSTSQSRSSNYWV